MTKLLMDGLTDKPAAGLVPLAKSWLHPVAAAPDTPVVNSAIVIRNWNGGARVLVNGRPGAHLGSINRMDGSDLIVWVEVQATTPLRIEVEAGS